MPTLLRYIIADDQEIDRLHIESLASAYPFLHKIAACSHPLEALELIKQVEADIIFVDIEMPDMSGLELIRMAGGKVPAPVFITSHPEFALESYEMAAFDYLLKPVSADRFERCALRLRDFFSLRADAFAFAKEQESGHIIIKQGHDKHKLQLNDVLYLEAMKDYIAIVTATKKYLVLGTISSMQDKLPTEKFARIHRSYIVNTDKIKAWKANKVLVDAIELPVGKMYKNMLSR